MIGIKIYPTDICFHYRHFNVRWPEQVYGDNDYLYFSSEPLPDWYITELEKHGVNYEVPPAMLPWQIWYRYLLLKYPELKEIVFINDTSAKRHQRNRYLAKKCITTTWGILSWSVSELYGYDDHFFDNLDYEKYLIFEPWQETHLKAHGNYGECMLVQHPGLTHARNHKNGSGNGKTITFFDNTFGGKSPINQQYHRQWLVDILKLLDENPGLKIQYKIKNPTFDWQCVTRQEQFLRNRIIIDKRIKELYQQLRDHPRCHLMYRLYESVFEAIAESDCVISEPFTSTTTDAVNLGIPAHYYDPTGRFSDPSLRLHGLTITGFDALQDRIRGFPD